MKHISWDYKGLEELPQPHYGLQSDWNATILTSLNIALETTGAKSVFVSEKYLDIFKTIVAFDERTLTIFDNKLIPLEINTPKVYVANILITDFTMLEHNNHGSVTIKNY